jgi:hypothetical protein
MKFTSAVVLSAATAVSATFGPGKGGWDSKVSSVIGAVYPSTFYTSCTTSTSVTAVPVVVKSSWGYSHESKTWESEAPEPTTYTVATSAAPVVTYAPVANTSVAIVSPTLSSTTAAPVFTGAASSKSWSAAAGIVAMLGFAAI